MFSLAGDVDGAESADALVNIRVEGTPAYRILCPYCSGEIETPMCPFCGAEMMRFTSDVGAFRKGWVCDCRPDDYKPPKVEFGERKESDGENPGC